MSWDPLKWEQRQLTRRELREEHLIVLLVRLRDLALKAHPPHGQADCQQCGYIREAYKVAKKWDQKRRAAPRE